MTDRTAQKDDAKQGLDELFNQYQFSGKKQRNSMGLKGIADAITDGTIDLVPDCEDQALALELISEWFQASLTALAQNELEEA